MSEHICKLNADNICEECEMVSNGAYYRFNVSDLSVMKRLRESAIADERERCLNIVKKMLDSCDCQKFCESFGCDSLRKIIAKIEDTD
jgi:hypothetical protein